MSKTKFITISGTAEEVIAQAAAQGLHIPDEFLEEMRKQPQSAAEEDGVIFTQPGVKAHLQKNHGYSDVDICILQKLERAELQVCEMLDFVDIPHLADVHDDLPAAKLRVALLQFLTHARVANHRATLLMIPCGAPAHEMEESIAEREKFVADELAQANSLVEDITRRMAAAAT